MSNKKISALSSASTPLTGSEIVPINQSGVTDSVSVANLTAGRSVSASDYVMSTGNLVPSTAAKGINFTANTPASGMTSQLLNWYEEGTWTPGFATWTTAPTLDHASYTRVGRMVTLNMVATGGVCVAGSSITGLPFTASSAAGASVLATGLSNAVSFTGAIFNNASNIGYLSAKTISTYWVLSCTYFV